MSLQSWFSDIIQSSRSLLTGLKVSGRHLKKGRQARGPVGIGQDNYFAQADRAVTIQYPFEQIPVPDMGRYRLHMETDDCIVCDKCARICPVDCIEIDGFKAVDDLGTTSDGTKKRLELATFNIDMAKCCFCGLCTTVCPTECLTMTKTYDFSEFDRSKFTYKFATLSPEEADLKRRKLEESKKASQIRPENAANS